MKKVEVSTDIYQWMTSCAIILTLIFLIIMFLYHLQTSCTKLKQFGNQTLILSFALILCGLMVSVGSFIINFVLIKPTLTAGYIILGVLTSAYILFKLVLYSLLSFRIYETFKESLFRCKKLHLILWETFLIISSIINILTLNLTSTVTINSESKPPVKAEYNTLVLVSIALTDLIACSVNFYLFGRKLYQILHQGVDRKAHESGFEYIVQKTCCLTYSAIISTLIALFLVGLVSMSIVWTHLDVIISVFSVMLMFTWNDKYFKCICGSCVNSIQSKATKAVTLSINTSANTQSIPESATHISTQCTPNTTTIECSSAVITSVNENSQILK
eukprot:341806_1